MGRKEKIAEHEDRIKNSLAELTTIHEMICALFDSTIGKEELYVKIEGLKFTLNSLENFVDLVSRIQNMVTVLGLLCAITEGENQLRKKEEEEKQARNN